VSCAREPLALTARASQGDDIVRLLPLRSPRNSADAGQFNRSMRLKASTMGYSLNQRGLYAGAVRAVGGRRVKTCEGARLPTYPHRVSAFGFVCVLSRA
jgi:hypothetical protein